MVFTDVPFVRQQRLNTVVGELVGARPLHLAHARPFGRLKAPLGLSLLRKREFLVAIGGHAAVVQPVHQFFHGRAIVVPLEGLYHKGGFQRVDLEELLLVHLEANGNRAAVVLPLQNILGHAAHNFFRKFCRVVFSHTGEHTLDHDTRRAVRDRLGGRYQLDMVAFQQVFALLCIRDRIAWNRCRNMKMLWSDV